jgi:hypothetical protein
MTTRDEARRLVKENKRLRALCGEAADFCDATMRRVSEGDGTQHMTFFFPPGHAETELGARLRRVAEGIDPRA